MTQVMSAATPLQKAKEFYTNHSTRLLAMATIASVGLSSRALADDTTTPIDVDAFNKDFGKALGSGIDAAKKVSCTGFAAFLGGPVAKTIFAAVLIIMLISAFYSFFADRRQGGSGVSRPFLFIIGFFIIVAITGVLLNTYMGCDKLAASTTK